MLGAIYYTGISGGAIFHTGSMTLNECNFTANEAGDEGLAVISIGLLESMHNVTFVDNNLHCAAGEYRNMTDVEVNMKGALAVISRILPVNGVYCCSYDGMKLRKTLPWYFLLQYLYKLELHVCVGCSEDQLNLISGVQVRIMI